MTDFFASSRLLYRAVDPAIDTDFLYSLAKDSEAQLQVEPVLPAPPTRANAAEYAKTMAEFWWLAVMICLRPASSSSDSSPTTIGYVSIQSWAGSMAIHRRGTLGIDIAAAHQRKGYGTEALEWAMNYGFEMAGLHTMGLSVVGWNAGAQRLYERMGFVRDGARRECFWAKGRFWDSIDMSMLESEWRQKYKGEKKVENQKQEMEEEYVLI